MVIDWERLAVLTGKGVLLVLEYMIKLSAFVVTAIVLSANGTFGGKLGAGFSSLSAGLRNVFGVPGDLATLMTQLRTYQADAASFIWEPGGYEALNSILSYLNGSIVYLDAVGTNFSNQPFSTFFAAVIGFVSLYATARLLRFYRQKGRGSRMVNLEQKLGERVFRKPVELQKPPAPVSAATSASAMPSGAGEKSVPAKESEPGIRRIRPAFSPDSENKFLEDYIRLAQNGGS